MQKPIEWSPLKGAWLKQNRGICFEDIISVLENEDFLDLLPHPNQKKYPHQRMYIIRFESYAYAVPFVEDPDKVFLKTIIPSRKYTRQYLQI